MRLGSKVIYSEIYTSFRGYMWHLVKSYCETPKDGSVNEYEYFKTRKRLAPILTEKGYRLTNIDVSVTRNSGRGTDRNYCREVIHGMVNFIGQHEGVPVEIIRTDVEWSHNRQVLNLSEPNENGFQVVKPNFKLGSTNEKSSVVRTNFFEKLFG